MTPDMARPPAREAEGNANTMTTARTVPPQGTPRALEWQELCDRIGGTFVVAVMSPNGRFVRRCYLSLPAARRAAERANERGQAAVVVLSELRPVYRVEADDRAVAG